MLTLPIHDGLRSHSRLGSIAAPDSAWTQWAALVCLGAAAAVLTEMVDFSLRLPGHAILRSVFPLALGLALAPRKMAGSTMGAAALLTSLVIRAGGWGGGFGSLVSVSLLGPCLDISLLRARSGWRIYAGMAGGALVANLAAFAMQLFLKSLARGGGGGGGGGGGRMLAEWLPTAVITYPLFGIAAGLISAVIWFRFRPAAGPPQAAKP
jgi:hypothetical protein